MGSARALKLFAEWTDRIAAGELPSAKPSRPQGVERNVVLTLWDWAGPKDYLHDEVSTDKRNPRVNANGLIYGATEESTDLFPVLDPVHHKATQVKMPVRDPRRRRRSRIRCCRPRSGATSASGTARPACTTRCSTRRAGSGSPRAFVRLPIRTSASEGSDHPSAKLTPIDTANRHLSMYDPKTGKITLISTCFPTHHLVFAEDANNTLWTSAGGPGSGVIGWLNRKMFEETGDEVKSQGWTALVLDTNGNGKRDEYVEPNQPVDPTKDKRIKAGFYGVAVNPADGTVWGSVLGFPGYVIRLDPGSNPPATALAEVFEPPLPGYGPRGMDIDRSGVVLDPAVERPHGELRPPQMQGAAERTERDGQALSRGLDAPSLPRPAAREREGVRQRRGELLHVGGSVRHVRARQGRADRHRQRQRVAAGARERQVRQPARPYPLGFYAKWMDGRVDDPNAGWKGKGLWATVSTRTPFHMEGGKGTTSKVVKFQLRPDPLAR